MMSGFSAYPILELLEFYMVKVVQKFLNKAI